MLHAALLPKRRERESVSQPLTPDCVVPVMTWNMVTDLSGNQHGRWHYLDTAGSEGARQGKNLVTLCRVPNRRDLRRGSEISPSREIVASLHEVREARRMRAGN